MYYVTIKDFKKFSNTKLFLDQGLNVIDGNLALNGDDYLMFLKDETQYPPEKNIRVTSSKNITNGYAPVSKPVTGDY